MDLEFNEILNYIKSENINIVGQMNELIVINGIKSCPTDHIIIGRTDDNKRWLCATYYNDKFQQATEINTATNVIEWLKLLVAGDERFIYIDE